MILRYISSQIEHWLFKEKVLVLYGPRQVGKTTLAKALLEKHGESTDYYSCDLINVREIIERKDPKLLAEYTRGAKLFVLDEAQQVRDIGLSLKLFHDAYPSTQVIATGSSSFDLANKLNEPLTGRSIEFVLYPFSLHEVEKSESRFDLDRRIETMMRFGSYPDVALTENIADRETLLQSLASNYLYKDVLMFENLRKPALLLDLLKLLALQLGNEVSVHELAVKLGVGVATIRRYIELLEKSFVLFPLRPLSRNLRNEIGKKYKLYFYDLGIRNTLIDRTVALDLRDDVGALWENFCILERKKWNQRKGLSPNMYFWRTHTGKEIDYIEEHAGSLHGYEFKWGEGKYKTPQEFLIAYKGSALKVVRKSNWWEFLPE